MYDTPGMLVKDIIIIQLPLHHLPAAPPQIYTRKQSFPSTASVFKNGQRLCGNGFGNRTGCSRGCLRCGLLSCGVEDLLDVLHQRLHLRLFVGLAGDFDVSQLPEIEVPVTFVRDSKFCKDKKMNTIG